MRSCVHILHFVRFNALLEELGKMCLVLGRIFLLQHLHVLLDMLSENAGLVRLGIVLGLGTFVLRWLVTWEVFGAVRDMEAAVDSTLQSAPHTSAHASGANAYVEDALEWAALSFLIFDVVLFAVQRLFTFECAIKFHLLEHPTSAQQACGIRPSVVGVADRDSKVC